MGLMLAVAVVAVWWVLVGLANACPYMWVVVHLALAMWVVVHLALA